MHIVVDYNLNMTVTERGGVLVNNTCDLDILEGGNPKNTTNIKTKVQS